MQSIDILRGIAILAVLAIHMPHDAPGGFRENIWFFPSQLMNYGYFGVHLFVLLSGYCIHRRSAMKKFDTGKWELNWLQFWRRRFWRLYPPYVTAMVVSLFAAAWLHDEFAIDRQAIVTDIALHLLMLHNLTADFGTSLGNGAFWSLGMEEQLYAGYFLLIRMIRRDNWRLALAVAGATTLAWRCVMPFVPWVEVGTIEIGKWYLWPMMFWLHWTLGALAVDASCGNITLGRWTRSLPVACGFLLIALLANRNFAELLQTAGHGAFLDPIDARIQESISWLGELFAAGGFFCLMNWMLAAENTFVTDNPISKNVASLGRISYSVYLVHVPVMYVVSTHESLPPSGINWLLRVLLYLALSIGFGALFFNAVERWFLGGRMPRLKPSPSIRAT
nr:acyltransferase [Rhodopirellula sp. JC639]